VGLVFASLFAATMFALGLLLVTVPIAVLYVPLLMTARWLSRRSMQRRVEDMLDQIERDALLPVERQRS
jgi:Flp pilus assembly protein TadB